MSPRKLIGSSASIAFASIVASVSAQQIEPQIVERTIDSATYRRVVLLTNGTGDVTTKTNQLTVLDHGLHYLQDGEFKESQDLVESFPGGAIARYGAYQTIFSPELNVPAAFDIHGPDGKRIQGGVRAIYLTDVASGQSVVLGTVKQSVPGQLVPPNQVVYRSAFDGVEADVLYIWKHNAFSQNVILKENPPPLPPGLDPTTTRLEIVTELVQAPDVQITSQVLRKEGNFEVVDHGLISFGEMLAVPGTAFPVDAGSGLNLTGPYTALGNTIPVLKRWQRLEDGRKFVIESVRWQQIEPALRDLRARAANPARRELNVAQGRAWPKPIAVEPKHEPMQLASIAYQPKGFLVDLELLPYGSISSKIFYSGITYYIPSSYWVTASSVFQGGSVIKIGPGGTLSLSGAFISPTTGVATLTSRDDDTVGERVVNAGSPPYTSDGVVSTSDWAGAALSLYNSASATTVQRFRIRYATTGVNDYSPYYTHTVKYCRLEYCATGVFAYYTTVNVVNNEVCNVSTVATAGTGGSIAESGTLTECGPLLRVASFPGPKQQDSSGGAFVPDTMGAVGQNHFMVVLNSGDTPRVKVYDKYSGVELASTSMDGLFAVTVPTGPYAGTYPLLSFDPRILYDHLSQRWIASAIDSTSKHVVLAVSNGSNPVGSGGASWVSDNWKKYLIPFGSSCGTDFDRLAVDGNGIYISVDVLSGECPEGIVALPKGPFLDGSAPTVLTNFHLPEATEGGRPIPVVNFDPVTTYDPIWFISVSGTNISYNALRWISGFTTPPQWDFGAPAPKVGISDSFSQCIQDARQMGSTGSIRSLVCSATLTSAMARKVNSVQYIWTCRHVGVNNAGNNDDPVGNPADRAAVEWLRIQPGATPTLSTNGRIYDPAAANPKFYFMPSLAVNATGDMLVGFSGSSVNDFVGAYYTGRLYLGATPTGPIRFIAGKDWFGQANIATARWGDYSHTSLDPDGKTIWTIQEYAEIRYMTAVNAFGTWVVAATPLW